MSLHGLSQHPTSRRLPATKTGGIVAAHLVFTTAEYASWFAVLVYAYDRGGATESGLIAALQLVPAGLAAPFLAHFVGRRRPGRALVAALALQAYLCGALAILAAFDAPAPLFYATAVALTVSFTLVRPCESGVLRGICRDGRHLSTTNTFVGCAESVGMLAGPALVALSTAVGFRVGLFVCLAVVLSASATANIGLWNEQSLGTAGLTRARRTADLPRSTSSRRHDSPLSRLVALLLGLRGSLIGTCDLLLLSVAVEFLEVGTDRQTTLNIAFGLGLVLGSLFQFRLVRGDDHVGVMIGSSLVFGLALAALALDPGWWPGLGLAVLAGVGAMTGQISGQTLLQIVAPPGSVTTLFGAVESATLFGGALGTLAAAGSVAWLGLTTTLVAAALFLPLVHLTLVGAPMLRAEAAQRCGSLARVEVGRAEGNRLDARQVG